MPELDVARHSLQIDPHLHIWGWEVVVYLFLGGMAAGVMILTTLLAMRRKDLSPNARWLGFVAPVLLSAGMGALFLDLAFKLHVFRFYLAFQPTSPMSWGSWILVMVYPVALLFALTLLDEEQTARVQTLAARVKLGALVGSARTFALRHSLPLRWLHLGLGAALGVYTGILLSTLGARAIWNSALLGPLFLASGLSAGAALLMVLPLSSEERHFAVRWDFLAIGLEVVLLALFLAGLATSGAGGAVFGGRSTAQFWTLVVLAGLVVPVFLELLESRFAFRPTRLAPALVLLGGFSLRWILVMAGQG
jgi:protein NrfD